MSLGTTATEKYKVNSDVPSEDDVDEGDGRMYGSVVREKRDCMLQKGDGRGTKGSSAWAAARKGAKVDMCRRDTTLGRRCNVNSSRQPLTAVHAKLEAVVSCARGTHQ